MVRILGFHCHGLGSIPGQGTEIPQAAVDGQKKSGCGGESEILISSPNVYYRAAMWKWYSIKLAWKWYAWLIGETGGSGLAIDIRGQAMRSCSLGSIVRMERRGEESLHQS